jgi:4-carboxymuconolactone decarboxylase
MSDRSLFETGLEIRRDVLGADYVDGGLAQADDFMMAFQRLTTEWCWGYAWSRPGLDRRTRSLLNLAMLTALGRPDELRLHTRGALANGVTAAEIREVLVHATVYCGIPAGARRVQGGSRRVGRRGAVDQVPPEPDADGP